MLEAWGDATRMRKRKNQQPGFTLIELSIVLVIIGLIVGGVLVGQNLIAAANIRAQVSQIEKYNTAVDTFRDKYGGIPGDLAVTPANQFGFNTTNCVASQGSRDGNGLIDGGASPGLYAQTEGETGLFWQDLSASHLIPDLIPNGGASAITCGPSAAPGLSLTPGTHYVGDYFPIAKIGQNNFMYVYETNGSNWYGFMGITSVDGAGTMTNPNYPLTVMQAYLIDSKYDDGNPTTGNIVNNYVNTANTASYYAGASNVDTTTSCFHYFVNGIYVPGYSITVNGGAALNCVLSFKFQ